MHHPVGLAKEIIVNAANVAILRTKVTEGKVMLLKGFSTIRSKLIIGCSLLILIVIATGVISLSRINLLGNLTVKMYNHPLTVTRASLQADVGIIKMHRSMKDIALAKDASSLETARKKVDNYEQEVYKEYAIVEERILGDEGKQLIAKTIQIFRDWKPIRDEVIKHMQAGERDAAATITKEKGAKHVATLDKKMVALVNYAAVKGEGFFNMAQAKSDSAYVLTISMIVVGTILGIGIVYLLARLIITPINKLKSNIEYIEQNSDLQQLIDISTNDEIGKTALAFNAMLEKFQALIQQIISSTTQLATASEQVSSVASESARNVERQIQETDQVATAINEMTATVQEVAKSATSAASAAQSADNESKGGKSVVMTTMQAIEDLANEVESTSTIIHQVEEDSKNIGNILDVIKGIAEQTNLLALNAAIEAARAGEQGRGFAVVADEVRTLASRTQDSTNEIQQMIEKLQSGSRKAVAAMEVGREKAATGVEHAKEASEALEAITRSVATINEMNTQIASAAEEQSSVAEEINKSIINIREVSELTANGSEQTTNTSQQLSSLATQLQSLVAQFKV
jgi:methyl-accepting chemotaxis protein